ncbi:MAG TPA: hypothetical protein VFF67_00695 [Thermoplasmata archaeon]|nr:hypothetical protein [Thermoplasmata archaeon]
MVGRQTVSVTVADADGSIASASRALLVVSAPSVSVGVSTPTGDVGRAVPFTLNVSYGTAPYRISWSEVGGSANGSVAVPADGWYLEPVVPSLAGALWISASIQDADGLSAGAVGNVAEVYPLPSLAVAPDAPLGEVGAPVDWGVAAIGGAPPLLWSGAATLPVNSSASSGRLDGPGSFTWATVPAAAGNLTVQLTATDSAGSIVVATATVRVDPATSVRVVPPVFGGAGAPAPVSAYIAGGDPPYSYTVGLSDGERFAGDLGGPGPVAWTAAPHAPGFIDITVSVTDALGVTTSTTLTVVVPAGSPAAPPPTAPAGASSSSGWTAWVGAAAGLLGLFAWWVVPKRLKRKPPTSGRSRAMRFVRSYLEDADGLDRATLRFLGDDDDLPVEAVDDALGHWSRLGRVNVRLNDDGDEEFRWGRPGTGAEPPPRPSDGDAE